jgi:hypothetical protein
MDTMTLDQIVELIVDALTGSTSAAIAAGVLTYPVTLALRKLATAWLWFGKKIKGFGMLALVVLVSTLVVWLWSLVPAVEMTFSVSAVLAAAGGAVLSRQGHKHGAELWKAIVKAVSSKKKGGK